MAIDNFCSAKEMSTEEKDVSNYQMARKFLHKLSQEIKTSEKHKLFAFLKTKDYNLGELNQFFKKVGDEESQDPPKAFFCAISMASS